MNKLDATIERQMLENSPVGILLTDSQSSVAYMNLQLATWLRGTAHHFIGKQVTDLDEGIQQLLQSDQELGFIRDSNDNKLWLEKSIGSCTGFSLTFFQDVTEKLQLENKITELSKNLNNQSVKDNVTGLMNQPLLMLALEPQVSRSRRYHSPISVMVMSLPVVDHGGPLTEAEQAHIAQFLKGQLRWADLIGRSEQGGFILVLPETKLDAAQQIAQKLTNLLPASLDSLANIAPLFGIAEWQKTDNATSLVERAQQDLQQHASVSTTT